MAPIAMVNALWFRPGGAARYAEYGAAMLPMLEALGADVILGPLTVEAALEGGFDPDTFFVVRYPSTETFERMWKSDDYAAVAPLRRDAAARAVLTRCAIDPADGGHVELEPGIAVLNALWFAPDGRERYDEYLAAARPIVERTGGRFTSPRFVPERAIEDDFVPDLIFVGNYPSMDALMAVVSDPAYEAAGAIRTEAVSRSVTTVLRVPHA